MDHEIIKQKLLDTVLLAHTTDLIRLSAGNISVKATKDLIAITPSGIWYKDLKVDDISVVDLDGNLIEGPTPSSETPMHTAIYRNIPRANSICHTHSIYGMVFAHLQKDIPLTNIELMVCGAPIPVAPWAAPGTDRAGEVTVDIYTSRSELSVVLLRQHGLIAIGNSLEQAFGRAYNAEIGLEVHYKVSLLGEAKSFTPEQIKEIQDVYGP